MKKKKEIKITAEEIIHSPLVDLAVMLIKYINNDRFFRNPQVKRELKKLFVKDMELIKYIRRFDNLSLTKQASIIIVVMTLLLNYYKGHKNKETKITFDRFIAGVFEPLVEIEENDNEIIIEPV